MDVVAPLAGAACFTSTTTTLLLPTEGCLRDKSLELYFLTVLDIFYLFLSLPATTDDKRVAYE
jgi:hypothetical protein